MNNSSFKISVIVSVFSFEKYLEESITSIINQSIKFENIQLILVNNKRFTIYDELCTKYKEEYPNNVIYVKNANISNINIARNYGLRYVSGKYVCFLDNDSRYSKNAFMTGYEMLENFDLDLVSFRVFDFKSKKPVNELDLKYKKGNRVIDLSLEPFNPFYYVSNMLISKKIIKNIRFDEKFIHSRDINFLSNILVKNYHIGVICNEYLYILNKYNSKFLIQGNLSFLKDMSEFCYDNVLNLRKKYENLYNYFTYILLLDLSGFIFENKISLLKDKERNEYIEIVRKLILQCDDRIICSRDVFGLHKIFKILDFKYNKPSFDRITVIDDYLCFDDIKIIKINDLSINVYNLFLENELLNVDICLNYFLNNNFGLYAKVGENKFISLNKSFVDEDFSNIYSYDCKYQISFFSGKIKLNDNIKNIEFYLEINNKKYKVKPSYSSFSKLNNCRFSYYKTKNYFITRNKYTIFVNKKSYLFRIKYLVELLIKKKDILLVLFIILYAIIYPFVKKDNWIICDREEVAGDNGEALFSYINSNKKKKNVYFALTKDSKDVDKIKKIGNIVYFRSLRFYLKYLNSQFIISSHIDAYINRPFERRQLFLNNIMNYKYIFLQHGIIKDDFSAEFNKYSKNASMFVTSTKDEYNLILSPNYMYDSSVVKLTGLPRYDKLTVKDVDEENLIVLSPTWRFSLVPLSIPLTQRRPYSPEFKNSDYFKFYNGLINDSRVIDLLKRYNFKLLFCLHPSFKAQIDDFVSNDYVEIKTLVDYPTVFKKAKLLITDYSSVVYDFAYLKKPIIYSQFDFKTFSESHTHTTRNSYDYKEKGFGDVVYDLDSTINKIVEIVESGCKMSKKYLNRVNDTFEYTDNKNCERVYNEILKLLKNANEK